MYDSMGSISIGLLMCGVAIRIITSNSSHLAGQSIPREELNPVVAMMQSDPVVRWVENWWFINYICRSVHDVKATMIGPDEIRLKAELDFNGRELTHAYLDDQDLSALLVVCLFLYLYI